MKYKIIDNFLNDHFLDYLLSLELRQVRNDDIFNHHNQIYKNGEIKVTCFDKKKLLDLHNSCHEKAMNILKELAPEKVDLYEYTDFNIIVTGKDYTFPIHRDHINKLLSGVIYLMPDKNTGTIIYDDKLGNNPREIEWKKNRGLFFSRTEKTSWHNYKGDGKNNRIVLVYNLMTKNTKAVCKIEGINYNLIRIREFLNPYLYRFFNITI